MDYGIELASSFEPDLFRDERVVWAGQPDHRFRLTPADVFLVPFSLIWGGFALFWEAGVLGLFATQPNAIFTPFALFGIPFVVIGQYLIWGRFIYRSYRARRTYYAVTTKRVLILTLMRARNLQSLSLDQIPSITKSVRRDGSGSLIFAPLPNWVGAYANSGMEAFGSAAAGFVPAFNDIKEVDSVYQLVLRQKNELPQSA